MRIVFFNFFYKFFKIFICVLSLLNFFKSRLFSGNIISQVNIFINNILYDLIKLHLKLQSRKVFFYNISDFSCFCLYQSKFIDLPLYIINYNLLFQLVFLKVHYNRRSFLFLCTFIIWKLVFIIFFYCHE